MSEFTITLDDREVKKAITGLTNQIGNMSVPLKLTGEDLKEYYGDEVFKTQGSALGEKWKPLSASTLKARRERRGYYAQTPIETNKILIWTGRLKNGFTQTNNRTRLVVSNKIDYFKYHQLGARRMLGINKDVIEIVVRRIKQAIDKSIV